MHNYRKLRVYEWAIDLAAETYRATANLPDSERYGLRRQMNRAGVSIVSNIAEGAGRGDSRDFARFLRIARGSACELEAQANLAYRIDLLDASVVTVLCDRAERVKAALTRLEQSLG